MKRFSMSFAIASLFILSAGSLQAQNTKAKAKSQKASTPDMPYTAMYSSQFAISDPSFSAIVLNAWKMYDDNSFDQSNIDFIADTVHAEMGNGMSVNGKDSFVNAIKSYRGTFSAVKSQVVAYLSVKSIDKNDHLVMIWGTETDNNADGTSQKADLNEVWGFNKDGKVDFFKQFVSVVPK